MSSPATFHSPPECMHSGSPEDSQVAKQAVEFKKRAAHKHFFWFSNPKIPTSRQHSNSERWNHGIDERAEEPSTINTGRDGIPVDIVESGIADASDAEDTYRWAILYENQRGITMFSMPHYSRQSLLPIDPPPFTIPMTPPSTSDANRTKRTNSKAEQPSVSLEDYPLPDGKWRWLSKTWMIDMQGDGAVQHDGFEYNWIFRSKNWRPTVGHLSAGGFVRRRRWVRLMVKPGMAASARGDGAHQAGNESPAESSADAISIRSRECRDVWRGDDGDWQRCHHLMRMLERDGRKLEVWKGWLGVGQIGGTDKGKRRQWTEDAEPLPSEVLNALESGKEFKMPGSSFRPNKEHVATVLRSNGTELLGLFVYPASRLEFVKLVADGGLQESLRAEGGGGGARKLYQ
ncbi:hypothetical protein BD410DRAFT_780942 [Rickenella mellea]|uniref:TECPR1-like DysF domain-containing protein n=1 Tax=Rickenella mellea TaxID=50990 RepID=A0A4Y7QNJ2_9AGAM|nr:hypothetical protein BD410DRAFT_780942 [Rickenella mellea]